MTKNAQTPGSDPVGKVLAGKYRIDALLKHGGMGAVYRATHLMLHKPIAIKLIKPELVTSEDTIRRFHREAQAASQLDHPNIVTIHDLGKAEDGTLYIAMELVKGISLKELVKTEGALEPFRAVRIASSIANALALAHRRHIIHRDLKPQNIMIWKDAEGQEQPKLLDFGIAKTFESDGPALTSTGLVLGTPHYMSPEQAKGTTVDGRSDLYALGIILYEMLVGKVPFEAPSIPAILVKHLNEAPKPPTALRPGLDPKLEAIVLRCLEKDPEKRYQTALELAQVLADAESTVTKGRPAGRAAAPTPVHARGDDNGSTHRATEPTAPLAEQGARRASPSKGSGGRGRAIALGVALFLFLALAGLGVWGLTRYFPAASEWAADSAENVPPGSPATAPVERQGATPIEETPAEAAAEETMASAAPTEPAALSEPQAVSEGERAQPVRQSDPPPAVSPAPPEPVAPPVAPTPLPADPPVEIYCEGLPDACAALRSELESSLQRAGLPLAGPEEPEVLVTFYTEEVESRVEQQFGTTFVNRTYSIETAGQATRGGGMVRMPPPEVFSFDTRFGRERLNERSRALAEAVTRSIRSYWTQRNP